MLKNSMKVEIQWMLANNGNGEEIRRMIIFQFLVRRKKLNQERK